MFHRTRKWALSAAPSTSEKVNGCPTSGSKAWRYPTSVPGGLFSGTGRCHRVTSDGGAPGGANRTVAKPAVPTGAGDGAAPATTTPPVGLTATPARAKDSPGRGTELPRE